jgi:hypothetical protein
MTRITIAPWVAAENGEIASCLHDAQKETATLMTISSKDVLKNTPLGLMDLISRMVENAIG